MRKFCERFREFFSAVVDLIKSYSLRNPCQVKMDVLWVVAPCKLVEIGHRPMKVRKETNGRQFKVV